MKVSLLSRLQNWAQASEKYWTVPSQNSNFGCYGTGYNGWGIQTQQKYIATMATLAHYGKGVEGIDTDFALKRALAALRYNLYGHLSSTGHGTDGRQWGHTWISALGIERMMFTIPFLKPYLAEEDLNALKTMLCSEANWLLTDYERGAHKGITAGLWDKDGFNDPESNIWNGALLWRTAMMYPDEPRADAWKERAYNFLINGVSIETDQTNSTIVDGKPVSERHVGANFFPGYALDHHGYFNVGYMVICVSNAAMLHFDMKALKAPTPESLYLHQADLWTELRKMVFADGRLARLGGDTRVRYAYCQDYLLPSLLFAADHAGDPHALELARNQLKLIEEEADYNPDGSFYGKRLAKLEKLNPGYYTRLESDRACAVAMYLAYSDLLDNKTSEATESFEDSVAGNWTEPVYGAVMHRNEKRLASYAWRAETLGQGLCLPPDCGHYAEWDNNLTGSVEFLHFPYPVRHWKCAHRKLLDYHVQSFDGGFITTGSIMEGVDLVLAEGWSGTDSARHQIAVVALPDGHTMLGIQFCKMGPRRGYLTSVKGLKYNLPNDLYNKHQRELFSANGSLNLKSPAPENETVKTNSNWLNIENRIGLVGLYGGDEFSILRHEKRTAGHLDSLQIEELCFPFREGPYSVEASEMILDTGWAVISSADAEATANMARSSSVLNGNVPDHKDVRICSVRGIDGKHYSLIANFGDTTASIDPKQLGVKSPSLVAATNSASPDNLITLESEHAILLVGE